MGRGFYEYYQQKVDQYAARVAMSWYDEQQKTVMSKTFAELCADVLGFAGALQRRFAGLDGKHIGIYAKNSYDYIVCAFGILCSGNVAVLLNHNEGLEQTRDELSMADVDMVLADRDYLEKLHTVCEPMAIAVADLTESVQNTAEYRPAMNDNADKLAMLIFTSGTSGKNKCVMLTVRNLLVCCKELQIEMDFANSFVEVPMVRYICFLPMYHIMAFTEIMSLLYIGHQINMCLNLRYMYRDLVLMESDYSCIVPVLFDRFYQDIADGHRERLGSLRGFLCGGAGMEIEKMLTFEKAGILIVPAYGLSETCGTGTLNVANSSHKYASVGRFLSGDLKVRLDQGEICLKGDSVMPGYYKDPEATAEAIQDGWLHTGDLGYLDEDGYLYITGRKKNLIILSNGENVSPEELEGLLLKNGDIREALVKEKNGKICAEIFCDAEKQRELRDFVTEVNRTLPLFKRMTLVEFRDEPFEKTGSGKIKRK